MQPHLQPNQGFLRDAPLFPPRASEMARGIDTTRSSPRWE